MESERQCNQVRLKKNYTTSLIFELCLILNFSEKETNFNQVQLFSLDQ